MTPTQQTIIDRSRQFHAKIAARAAELRARRAIPIVVVEAPPPPEPERDLFTRWMESWSNHPTQRGWFSIAEEINPSFPSISLVLRVVCNHFNLTKAEMFARYRAAPIVRARQVGMFLAKEMTKRSLPEIGRRFGGKDHTTVLHSIRKIALCEKQDEAFAAELESIRAQIRSQHENPHS